MRIVIDAIEYYDKHPEKEVGFFFADAEKAFDNLNWDFMFLTMEKMEFGEGFINAVKAIYQEQCAMICVNNDLTEKFKVEKGTRQGCPLSPLLFVLVLEILLRQIKEDKTIKGLDHRGFSYKYRAFADDVMFILENPLQTLPILLSKIKEFGDLAGFYINKSKSKIMCKNMVKSKQDDIMKITECEVVKKPKIFRS